jgi:hypothetical protein
MTKALPIKLSVIAIEDRNPLFEHMRQSSIVRSNSIFYAAVVAIVLGISGIGIIMSIGSAPLRTQTVDTKSQSQINIGPSTQELLNQLQQSGLILTPVMQVHKSQLSVVGTLFTVEGDNVQIFEYQNNAAALADALKLGAMYSKDSQLKNAWGSMVHIYSKDNLVIFYMGYNTTPSKALDLVLGKPVS